MLDLEIVLHGNLPTHFQVGDGVDFRIDTDAVKVFGTLPPFEAKAFALDIVSRVKLDGLVLLDKGVM